jgi:hypothetical protein
MLVAMLVFALTTKAQSLLGIPFSGNTNTFKNELVKKGFVVQPNKTGVKNVFILKGTILGRECNVFVFGTPKTNQVYKMVAYTPEETNFTDLSSTFDVIQGYLEEKYGKGEDECLDYFKSPYERYDGYEMTAIKVNKYLRMCLLGNKEPNMSVAILIEKYPQVKMIWENVANTEVNKAERLEKAKNEL